MTPDYEITQGDSAPPWTSTLGDATGDALILSGSAVAFYIWDPITDTKVTLTGSASVIDATTVEYQPVTADFATLTPGDYWAKWRVTFPGGQIESFPSDHQVVRVFAAPPIV